MMNLKELISKEFCQSINKTNEQSYLELITDVREDLADGFDSEILSSGFIDQLAIVIEDKALNKFNPYTYYWSQLLDQLIHLIQIHEDIEGGLTKELEAELHEFWIASEFSESFNELIEQKAPAAQASDSLMTLLENQILAFFHLHISSKEQKIDDVLLYNAIPEIGDTENTLFVGIERRVAVFDIAPDLFPLYSIKKIHESRTSMEVEINTDVYELPVSENNNFIDMGSNKISFLCLEEKHQNFTSTVREVLEEIKTSDKDLYNYLGYYTHSIVPLESNDKATFAHPSYLGFSNIETEFTTSNELLFKLFSLNGLHQINSLMAEQDLVFETSDDYYNPWADKKTALVEILRDCYGHFWGYKVLTSRLQNSQLEQTFERELLVQSFYKIAYSLQDLSTGFESGQITPMANELIQLIGDFLADTEKEVTALKTAETEELIAKLKA